FVDAVLRIPAGIDTPGRTRYPRTRGTRVAAADRSRPAGRVPVRGLGAGELAVRGAGTRSRRGGARPAGDRRRPDAGAAAARARGRGRRAGRLFLDGGAPALGLRPGAPL